MCAEPDSGDVQPPRDRAEYRDRDGTSLKIIGGFFSLFSILVLVGTFWEKRSHGIVVNLTAGFLLLSIGLGMFFVGRRMSRR